MIVALIDNGSLEPAAPLNLRAVAAALSTAVGVTVHPVSWKHSDRLAAEALEGLPAQTLHSFVRAHVARGERGFVFVPFFISAQGAIGSALRGDLETLRTEASANGGFGFTFTEGLASRGAVAGILAERVRETIASRQLERPPVVVVDHGGPSLVSAALRDSLAHQVATILGAEAGPICAASMEGAHPPLLAQQLANPPFNRGDIVVALLFLSPGRHAGPHGDIAQICQAAEVHSPGLHCHLTDLVGTHSATIPALALALRETLANFHAHSSA